MCWQAGQALLFRTHIALPFRLARRLGPLRIPPGGELAVWKTIFARPVSDCVRGSQGVAGQTAVKATVCASCPSSGWRCG